MGNRIELAKSSRSKCVTCSEVIPKGGVRLAEETRDIGIPDLIHRFYHLECAAAVHPELVANALQHVEHGAAFDRAKIEAKIAPAIERAAELRKQKYLAHEAEKAAKQKVVVVEHDAITTELFEQLAANPDDPGTLAVVADQLQARGDIRGELIGLQLAAPSSAALSLEGDDDEETDAADRITDAQRRSQRCVELMDRLGIPVDASDKVVWGVGFIRRLELNGKNGTRLSALAPIWAHPSLRFLRELRLTFASNMDTSFVARLAELAPRSLRRLEIGERFSLPGLAALVAALPKLESLVLDGRVVDDALAHPSLRALDVRDDVQNLLPRLQPKQLPALTELAITGGSTQFGGVYERDTLAIVATSLGGNTWFGQLTHLAWRNVHGEVTADDVTALAAAIGKKHKLARLDLTGTKVPLALRDKLATLCDELVAPDLALAADAVVYVEHTAKPEWGRGKLVRKHEGKVEIEFGKPVGKKVFKADAPFLRLIA